MGGIALACDPLRLARQIDLRIGSTNRTRQIAPGSRALDGAEPLLPGETLTLTWRHPSPSAVLSLHAKTPTGLRRVTLALPSAPERVDVTAQADGGLQVVTPAGVTNIAAPQPEPTADERWHPRTARDAARQLLHAVDRMDWSTAARKTLCAAMDPGVRAYLEPQVGDYREEYPCDGMLELAIFADENVPKVVSTTHRGFALAMHGGRAVLSTQLVHRFHRYDDPRRLAIRARVLLARDGRGIWRLATISSLLPLVAVDDPHHVDSDRGLQREYLALVRAGRRLTALLGRLESERAAATVDSSGPAPCGAPLATDPAGDVTVVGSNDRARDQAAHADVDVVGFAALGRCVAVRTSSPLPSTFELDVQDQGTGRSFHVELTDGRALVEETTDNDADPKPLRGVVAHLGADGFALSVPVALSGNVRMDVHDERPGVAYGDDVSSVPAATPRCARPTC